MKHTTNTITTPTFWILRLQNCVRVPTIPIKTKKIPKNTMRVPKIPKLMVFRPAGLVRPVRRVRTIRIVLAPL